MIRVVIRLEVPEHERGETLDVHTRWRDLDLPAVPRIGEEIGAAGCEFPVSAVVHDLVGGYVAVFSRALAHDSSLVHDVLADLEREGWVLERPTQQPCKIDACSRAGRPTGDYRDGFCLEHEPF